MVNKSMMTLALVFMVSTMFAGCDMLFPKSKKTARMADQPLAGKTAAVKAEAPSASQDEKDSPLPAGVLARVGQWTLTLDEFNERLKGVKQVIKDFDETQPGAKETVLDELMRQQLLVFEGRRQKIDQSRDIRNAVNDFENTLIVQEFAGALIKNIQVQDQDVRDYYENNPGDFVTPVEKRIREIVLSTENEAKDVLVSVLQGADFAQTARNRSKSRSAANDGDLGFLLEMPFEQMQKEVDLLKKGDVSRVFSGPDGYYIIKVEDTKGGEKQAFLEVKDKLKQWLLSQRQQQAVLEKMAEIAKQVKVQVNVELLKDDKR